MIIQAAGILAIDPDAFTLRELLKMLESKQQSDWWHTASILAVMHNMLSTGDRLTANDFNPYVQKKKKIIKGDGSVLKELFCK